MLNKKKIQRYLVERFIPPNTKNVFGYAPFSRGNNYAVYKRKIGCNRIEAAYGNVVVLTKNQRKTILIYPDVRYPIIKAKIAFNEHNFPGLIKDSVIEYCAVLPYLRMVTPTTMEKSWRVVIVTDKAQIFHNYPARENYVEGRSLDKDISCFEESVIWDLPSRKYPANNLEHDSTERFFPGLPAEAYEYHPAVNQKSIFGNNGFPKTKEVDGMVLPRFYIPQRKREANPFYYMSGLSSDYKMTLLGTYRSNLSIGVRTCVFATDDGGRQWHCKYEFGDMGEYEFQQGFSRWGYNFGNKIHLDSDILTSETVVISKRSCVVPNSSNKDPKESFMWGDEIEFTSVSCQDTLILKSNEPHGLITGNVVTVIKVGKTLEWMVNNDCNTRSAGNGLLFKVECIDENTIKMYEYVSSPDNPISCRHIHHINRVRDGWIIGTGELYPNSWLLYMQMKEADTFAIKHAHELFDTYRLNSSENSVQRTLGLIWNDDGNNTILYASDHDVLNNKKVSQLFDDREITVSRNATGIYRGQLKDIDDHNSFSVVYEAMEPAYLFRKIEGAIVFSGQRGEIAISYDNGDTWDCAHVDGPLNHPKGGTYDWFIFDDYLLILNDGGK